MESIDPLSSIMLAEAFSQASSILSITNSDTQSKIKALKKAQQAIWRAGSNIEGFFNHFKKFLKILRVTAKDPKSAVCREVLVLLTLGIETIGANSIHIKDPIISILSDCIRSNNKQTSDSGIKAAAKIYEKLKSWVFIDFIGDLLEDRNLVIQQRGFQTFNDLLIGCIGNPPDSGLHMALFKIVRKILTLNLPDLQIEEFVKVFYENYREAYEHIETNLPAHTKKKFSSSDRNRSPISSGILLKERSKKKLSIPSIRMDAPTDESEIDNSVYTNFSEDTSNKKVRFQLSYSIKDPESATLASEYDSPIDNYDTPVESILENIRAQIKNIQKDSRINFNMTKAAESKFQFQEEPMEFKTDTPKFQTQAKLTENFTGTPKFQNRSKSFDGESDFFPQPKPKLEDLKPKIPQTKEFNNDGLKIQNSPVIDESIESVLDSLKSNNIEELTAKVNILNKLLFESRNVISYKDLIINSLVPLYNFRVRELTASLDTCLSNIMQSYYTIPNFLHTIDSAQQPHKAVFISILNKCLDLYKHQLSEHIDLLKNTAATSLEHQSPEVRRNMIFCLVRLSSINSELSEIILKSLSIKHQKLFEIYKSKQ